MNDYGARAHNDLIVTRGDGFRKVSLTRIAVTWLTHSVIIGEEQEETRELQRRRDQYVPLLWLLMRSNAFSTAMQSHSIKF